MKKVVLIIIILIVFISLFVYGKNYYNNYRIKHAKKIVTLKYDEVEVYDEIKVKDIINKINGKLLTNPKIDTTKIGVVETEFKYINDDKIKIPYTIKIKVVDKTPPLIGYKKKVILPPNSKKKELVNSFFCGDNYDDNPKCIIEGDYDLKDVGEYDLTFKGIDNSNNTSTNTFTLIVEEKEEKKSKKNITVTRPNDYDDYVDIKTIIKEYKTKNTSIGIDISYWQDKIDFKKVKKSGVEFAYIRVGRGNGVGKEYIEDEKFEEYIKGFNKVNIPVGVYFYSNANSIEDAKKEAKWLLSKIKKYKVDLEVVFDWENWNYYYEYNLSFYNLTKVAETFMNTVEKKGYTGMLYSSKYYLENIWFETNHPVWLAHYTKKTNYEGKYKVWQLCDNGKVKGIDKSLVDIDIRYN